MSIHLPDKEIFIQIQARPPTTMVAKTDSIVVVGGLNYTN